MYSAPVKSVLLCGSEMWPLRADVPKRLVLGHRYLHGIGRIWHENFVSH